MKRGGHIRRKPPREPSAWRRQAAIPVAAVSAAQEIWEAALGRRAHRAWVHSQPCLVGEHSPDPCDGRVQAAHQDFGKAKGRKVDLPEVPLCERHHTMLGNGVHGAGLAAAVAQAQFLRRLVMALALTVTSLRYGRREEAPF